MALNLTSEQIKQLNIDANSAEPYADNAPELMLYDGDRDSARMKATCAKKMLEQDAREKADAKNERLR